MTAHTISAETITLEDGRTYPLTTDGRVVYTCWKCDGSGFLPHYAGIYAGECFACRRTGNTGIDTVENAQRKARNRIKAAARRAAKAEAEAKARRDAFPAWLAEHGALVARARAVVDADPGRLSGSIAGVIGAADMQIAPVNDRVIEWAEVDVTAAEAQLARAAERVARAVAGGHVGTIGARLEVQVEVVFRQVYDNDYGRTALIRMVTAEGAELSTWSSGAFGWGVERGSRATIRGTVKSHTEYEGRPQTALKNVKAVGAVTPPPAKG